MHDRTQLRRLLRRHLRRLVLRRVCLELLRVARADRRSWTPLTDRDGLATVDLRRLCRPRQHGTLLVNPSTCIRTGSLSITSSRTRNSSSIISLRADGSRLTAF